MDIELVKNRGFETGDFTDWTIDQGAPIVDDTYAHEGVYSCRLYYAAEIVSQTFAKTVPKGDLKTFQCWVYGNTSGFNQILGVIHDGGQKSEWGTTFPAWVWSLFEILTNIKGSGVQNVEGVCFRHAGQAYVWFDEFSVSYEVKVGGAGLGGVSTLPWILARPFRKRFPKLQPLRV